MDKVSDSQVSLVIVGSVALDTIVTPWERRVDQLGGSVSYACAASSLFAKTGVVGVVGADFPSECFELYDKIGIDSTGLETLEGETFRWEGEYEANMEDRKTLSTRLNVFETFEPTLPDAYKQAPFVFLANISPDLQLRVLDQTCSPEFTVADTMDLWIETAREDLIRVIGRVDMLMINLHEARQLTGEHNLRSAIAKILDYGPEYVVIKKGEHGAILGTRSELAIVPGYPVEYVKDTTGAGDSFAGGFMGALAKAGEVNHANIREALLCGSVVASFGVQAFGLQRLVGLTHEEIDERMADLRTMVLV